MYRFRVYGAWFKVYHRRRDGGSLVNATGKDTTTGSSAVKTQRHHILDAGMLGYRPERHAVKAKLQVFMERVAQ